MLFAPLNFNQAKSVLIEYAREQSEANVASAVRMQGTSHPKIYHYLIQKGKR